MIEQQSQIFQPGFCEIWHNLVGPCFFQNGATSVGSYGEALHACRPGGLYTTNRIFTDKNIGGRNAYLRGSKLEDSRMGLALIHIVACDDCRKVFCESELPKQVLHASAA